MSRIKPAEVKFYIDADLPSLARVLAGLRPDVTYPGDPGGVVHKRERPACPIASRDTKDPVWIPEVARRGWLIITRDRHIHEHRLEIAAVRDNGARMVVLVGDDARTAFDQVEVVMCQWRHITKWLADEKPPFIYAITRSHERKIPLD